MRRAGLASATHVPGIAVAMTTVIAIMVLALAALLPPGAALAKGGKRHSGRHWHGYGFLPGYEPPQVVQWRRDFEGSTTSPTYWYGGPQFYHGRWNGGGFGPCWTQTPIGAHWNCG